MSVEEPQGLGAVVEAATEWPCRLFVRVQSRVGALPWVDPDGDRYQWSNFIDPVILHEGYTPPTPEPTVWGAVVRDAEGCRFSRTSDNPDYPWLDPLLAVCKWPALVQPVEVLFEGVAE